MAFIPAFFGFILGTVIGSFLNVLVLRGEKNQSLGGRSYCPHCKHQLSWSDNIPLLSFLLLQGKCRYCRNKISWQYLLVEAVTGLVFAVIFFSLNFYQNLSLGDMVTLLYSLFFACVLISVSLADIKWGIIPDRILLPSMLVAVLILILRIIFPHFFGYELVDSLGSLAGAVVLGTFFIVIILATLGRGMGMGDAKLAVFIGFSLPFATAILAIFLAFLTGALVAVMLLLLGRKKVKQTIAFGPFLSLGALLALVFGNWLVSLYLKTLGL